MSRKTTLSPLEKAYWEARAKSHLDVMNNVSACPLTGDKVQLIPLRYGRVERLHSKPDGERYRNLKRPLGLRLVRDGYLYIIEESSRLLHEYRLADGLLEECLWRGGEVTQDLRQTPVGEPELIFAKDAMLHVAYAELQWSAAKCSQVLHSAADRYYFMQQIHLAKADCQHGGKHLRVEMQVALQLAEVAEPPAAQCAVPGTPEQEREDYCWEHQRLFREAHIGELKQILVSRYEHDHLYLVLEDSLGIMQDLAQEQDTIVDWISNWREEHDNELRYITASYIDTLMTVGEHTARKTPADLPLLLHATTEQERTRIYAWVNARNKWLWEHRQDLTPPYRHGITYSNRGEVIPMQTPATQLARQTMDLRQQEMIKALGKQRYEDLKSEIEALNDTSQGVLNGVGIGARGIHDLVRHEEMQSYLQQERAHLKRWQQRLDEVSEDRVELFASGEFHRSAWYFNPAERKGQLHHALSLEQNCMRDLCRTDEGLRKVGEFFDNNPHFILPAFQTRLDVSYLKTKVGDLTKWLDDTRNFTSGLADASSRLAQIERIMNNHWSTSLNLPPQLQALHQGVLASYIPAIANSLNDWHAQTQSLLDSQDLKAHLDKMAQATNRAQRLGMLVALQTEGLHLQIANESDIAEFKQRLVRFHQWTEEETQLRRTANRLRKRAQSRRLTPEERYEIKQERHLVQQKLSTVRHQRRALGRLIDSSTSPTNTLPSGYIGVRLDMPESQRMALQDEVRRVQAGALGGYGTSGTYRAAFKSGLVPSILSVFQLMNLKSAVETGLKDSKKEGFSYEIFLPIFVALISFTNSSLTAYQLAKIAMLDRTMARVATLASHSAGALPAVKIGKLGLGLGGGVAILNVIPSAYILGKNMNKWRDAISTGTWEERTAAFIGLSGDLIASGVAVTQSGAAVKEFGGLLREVLKADPSQRKLVANQAWATRGTRFLSLSARLNLWGLAALALQLAGETLYNFYHLDHLQRWLVGCVWGTQPQGWSDAQSRQKLAESTLRPTIIDKGIAEDPATQESARVLQLILPAMTPGMLDSDSLRWRVTWLNGPDKREFSEFFREMLSIAGVMPLTLQLSIPTELQGHQVTLELCLAVKPALAEDFLNADTGYLNYRVTLTQDMPNKSITPLIVPPSITAELPPTQITRKFINDNR
ncbi:toxin VasX [Pseudomonas sp. LJDD11]|uniref:toxin VasX n=4 Tax=Pseudomonadota TaxID=1224 RepID=UPI0027B9FBBE|nr:toxin VasX [Pseudomonas sp. LJDD11]